MNSHTKLTASVFLIKRAFANYLGMGGAADTGGYAEPAPTATAARLPTTINPNYANARGRGIGSIQPMERAQPSAAIKGLATHNLGANSSNVNPTKPPTASPAANTDLNATFKKYMGSAFDPNSKLDQSKMKYLQGLADKGVTMNAANIYDKGQGYGKF